MCDVEGWGWHVGGDVTRILGTLEMLTGVVVLGFGVHGRYVSIVSGFSLCFLAGEHIQAYIVFIPKIRKVVEMWKTLKIIKILSSFLTVLKCGPTFFPKHVL